MSDGRFRTLEEGKPAMSTPKPRRAPQSNDGLDDPRTALAGSVVLVTSGGRCIGRLVNRALADASMPVGLAAQSEHELAAAGLRARLHQHDPTTAADPAYRRALSQEQAIRRMYDPWSVRVTASDLQYDNVRRAERRLNSSLSRLR
jgi:hypothetical protein